MKKLLCTVIMVVILIGNVPTIAEYRAFYGNDAKALNIMNKIIKGQSDDVLKGLFMDYDTCTEYGRSILVPVIHSYYSLYTITYDIDISLIQYEDIYNEKVKKADYLTRITKKRTDEDKWEQYLDGVISADEYVAYIREVYKSEKRAGKGYGSWD